MKTDLEQRVIALEGSRSNRLEPLRNFIFEANQAQKWLCENNSTDMNSFLKKVGSNRLLRSQTLTVTFTKPFDSLAETVVAVRSTSDLSEQTSKWWSRAELISSLQGVLVLDGLDTGKLHDERGGVMAAMDKTLGNALVYR